jgi:hypothetical protein
MVLHTLTASDGVCNRTSLRYELFGAPLRTCRAGVPFD